MDFRSVSPDSQRSITSSTMTGLTNAHEVAPEATSVDTDTDDEEAEVPQSRGGRCGRHSAADRGLNSERRSGGGGGGS